MKILKWTALIVIIVAVVAAVLHLRRDAIATGIANSILSEQDLRVIDLSVDALTPDRLELAELVVESAAGTRYKVLGLSLPVRTGGTRIRRFAAEGLIVTFERAQDSQTMLSTALHTALELPLSHPGLEATIARVSLPKLPELADVSWATSESGQDLSFTVGAISVVVGAEGPDAKLRAITIRATHHDGEDVLNADIDLTPQDGKYRADGTVMIRTAAWLPVLKPLDVIPAGLDSLDATLTGPIELLFDEHEAGHAAFSMRLGLVDQLSTTYRSAGGSLSNIRVAAVDQLDISIDYPSFDWAAGAGSTEAALTTDDFDDLPVLISDLQCRSGIQCTMQAAIDTNDLNWNGYDFSRAELSLPLAIDLNEVARIGISSTATGTFNGVRTSGFSAETVRVVSFSGTQLIIDDDAWRCGVENLQLAIDGFAGAGDLVASFPLSFDNLDVRDSAQSIETRVSTAPSSDAVLGGAAILLPGAAGTVSIRDDNLTSLLELKGRKGAVSAAVVVALDLAADAGSINVNNARVSFDHASLSRLVPGLPFPVDIVDGTWDADFDIEWQTTSDITRYGGRVTTELNALAGQYNNVAFVGLSTKITAKLDPAGGFDMPPASLAIRLVDVGLPLENIAASFDVDLSGKSVQVDTLSAAALGGTFTAKPFEYSANAETNVIPLQAHSVQLQLMADLLVSEGVEMTGAMSGDLPVIMSGNNITIEAGKLRNDPPGGVIRYRSDGGALEAAVSGGGLNVITRALTNFEFDALTSDVDYTPAGDLKLRMRLSGINPDMDATQPYIFNLNVENNVPQLLRSLQAIRSIEDILERQTANQAP